MLLMDHPATATGEAMRLLSSGNAAAKSGRREAARSALGRAAELEPSSEWTWLWLAGVEEPREAVRCLERVLAINSGNDRALAGLRDARLKAGAAAAQTGERDAARAFFLAVTARDPDCVAARLWLAGLARTPQEALAHSRHVLMLDPNNTQAREVERVCRDRLGPTADPGWARVLVVDDSEVVRHFVSLALLRYGCEVMTASDGLVALQLMAECGAPHLIFLDTTLPGPDGYEIAARLRERPDTAAVPVVLLTRRDAPFDDERGRLAGVAGHLLKPFAPEQILEAVQRHAPAGV